MCRVERLLSGISRLARRAALSSLVKEDAKKHISQKLIIIINRTLFGSCYCASNRFFNLAITSPP